MQLEGNFLREFAMLVDSVKMRQDITSNNSYQESVTAILCKSATEILSWKTHYWMKAQTHVLRYAILAIPSLLYCILNLSLQWEHLPTLHQKSCQEKNTMGRLQMFGLVGLPCTSCWSVHIPLKILKIQGTSGKQFSVEYSIPDYVRISKECKHLLFRIFVAEPEKRITIPEIEKHPWFVKYMPVEFTEGKERGLENEDKREESQVIEQVLAIVQEGRKHGEEPKLSEHFIGGSMDLDDTDADANLDDTESSGDFVCAL
uniref:Serine/threonine-protein kinase SAPK2 isoform X1 n=1 Tax=Rhizophora mucronata TaxID=61149 RepID=A0A2P2KKQ6_RHIMU